MRTSRKCLGVDFMKEITVQFHKHPKVEHILPKLPPADEEGRVKIRSSYSNCLDPEKEVP